jgi:hypothetical protein
MNAVDIIAEMYRLHREIQRLRAVLDAALEWAP